MATTTTTTTRGNAFALDAQGEAVLLSSRGQQVMMQWERQYMERCVDALRVGPRDAVLEIGFGLAYSATRVQAFAPARHVVIECDAAVLERAHVFAAQHAGVEIVAGTWQRVLPALREAFDCVFFDDYPLPELEADGTPSEDTSARRSRWHDFLDVVLHHVRPGARITGYLARPLDLRREGCVFEMTRMSVAASSSCEYYPHDEAFVPVITVVDPAAARASTRHLLRERLDHVRERLALQQVIDDISDDPEELHGDDEQLRSPSRGLNESSSSPREATSTATDSADATAPYGGFASRSAFLASLRARREHAAAASSHLPASSAGKPNLNTEMRT